MKNALAATRATLTWLVVTASLVTAGLISAVPAGAATKTYTASAVAEVHASPAATAAVLGTVAKGAHVAPHRRCEVRLAARSPTPPPPATSPPRS